MSTKLTKSSGVRRKREGSETLIHLEDWPGPAKHHPFVTYGKE